MDKEWNMCGIAAISIPMDARVNARELTHALLTEIESRGTHASGFAYYGADGSFGVYKNNKPGSQLPLSELPRDAKTVIIHTRYATQGPATDNRNNHPVMSTDNNIALVHNGVISNDYSLRGELGITAEEHGLVDSLVIPSLIAQQGVSSLTQLSGYAAIAWINATENGELHIAKLKNSPVSYTWTTDGAFVMASTSGLLEMALISINQEYGGVFELAEGRMLEVSNGFIMDHAKAPSMSYSHQAWKKHSTATAGGKKADTGSGVVNVYGRGSEDTTPLALTPGADDADSCELTVQGYYEDLEKWRKAQAEADLRNADKPAVLFGQEDWYDDDSASNGGFDEAKWEEIVSRMEEEEDYRLAQDEEFAKYGQLVGEGFYIVNAEGDMTHHPILEDLEARLRWLSKMTRHDYDLYPELADEINWANHIMDLGSVTEKGELVSWVDDSADIDNYESPAVRNLQYVRDGVHLLERLKGA